MSDSAAIGQMPGARNVVSSVRVLAGGSVERTPTGKAKRVIGKRPKIARQLPPAVIWARR